MILPFVWLKKELDVLTLRNPIPQLIHAMSQRSNWGGGAVTRKVGTAPIGNFLKKWVQKGPKWGFKAFLGVFEPKNFFQRLWHRKIAKTCIFGSKNWPKTQFFAPSAPKSGNWPPLEKFWKRGPKGAPNGALRRFRAFWTQKISFGAFGAEKLPKSAFLGPKIGQKPNFRRLRRRKVGTDPPSGPPFDRSPPQFDLW